MHKIKMHLLYQMIYLKITFKNSKIIKKNKFKENG